MKRYIKPNTDIVAVELQQMIAESVGLNSSTEVGNSTDGWQDLGKEQTGGQNLWED